MILRFLLLAVFCRCRTFRQCHYPWRTRWAEGNATSADTISVCVSSKTHPWPEDSNALTSSVQPHSWWEMKNFPCVGANQADETNRNIQREDWRIMISLQKHFFPKFSMCEAESKLQRWEHQPWGWVTGLPYRCSLFKNLNSLLIYFTRPWKPPNALHVSSFSFHICTLLSLKVLQTSLHSTLTAVLSFSSSLEAEESCPTAGPLQHQTSTHTSVEKVSQHGAMHKVTE